MEYKLAQRVLERDLEVCAEAAADIACGKHHDAAKAGDPFLLELR